MALELHPMRGGELLDRTFSFLRQELRLLTGIMLVTTAAGLILPLVFLLRDIPARPTHLTSWILPYSVVIFGFWIVVGPATEGAIAAAIASLVQGVRPTVRDSWRQAARQIPALIGASLLKFLIATGTAFVFVIPLSLFAVARSMTGPIGIVAAVITLAAGVASIGFLVWVIVGLAFQVMVVVIEEAGPGSSVKRSWDLTRGGRSHILIILFLYWTFIANSHIAIKAVMPSLGVWIMQHGGSLAWAIIVSIWVSTVASVPLVPFAGAGLTFEYFNQRTKKEGFDLQMMMNTLEAPPNDFQAPGILITPTEPRADGQ